MGSRLKRDVRLRSPDASWAHGLHRNMPGDGGMAKRKATKRELINTGKDKRFVLSALLFVLMRGCSGPSGAF